MNLAPLGPFTPVLGQKIAVIPGGQYAGPAQLGQVRLVNLSGFSCSVSSSSEGDLPDLAPFTTMVYDAPARGGSLSLTPVSGSAVVPAPQITGQLYVDGGTFPGTYPQTLPVTVVDIAAGATVGISGTPTIDIAAGAVVGISGTPSVDIAAGAVVGLNQGTVVALAAGSTVDIGGTPTVDIAAGASVAVSGTADIQGPVTVLPSPDQILDTSGAVLLIDQAAAVLNIAPGTNQDVVLTSSRSGAALCNVVLVMIHEDTPGELVPNVVIQAVDVFVSDSAANLLELDNYGADQAFTASPGTYYNVGAAVDFGIPSLIGNTIGLTIKNNSATATISESVVISVLGYLSPPIVENGIGMVGTSQLVAGADSASIARALLTDSTGVLQVAIGGNVNATEIQGTPVATGAPTTNQILEFNGTDWAPATPSGGAGVVIGHTFEAPTTEVAVSVANAGVLTALGTEWEVSFTAPASGNILIEALPYIYSGDVGYDLSFGWLNGLSQVGVTEYNPLSSNYVRYPLCQVISGLTAGDAYTLSLAACLPSPATASAYILGAESSANSFPLTITVTSL